MEEGRYSGAGLYESPKPSQLRNLYELHINYYKNRTPISNRLANFGTIIVSATVVCYA